MQALYYDGDLRLRDLPLPELKSDEVLIRVLLAGVCRTDLEVIRGYRAFRGIPGHEFVGLVAGPEDSPWLGRRVVGEINIACGACDLCLRGLSRYCRGRRVPGLRDRNGTFAEYLTLPAANLHQVPDNIAAEAAVFTEPLAAALAVTDAVPHLTQSRILVVGDGVLGLLCCSVLALQGSEVHLAGHYPEHLRLAEAYGASGFLERELPGGDYDVIVEASGSPSGLTLALERVRPQGTVVLKSTYKGQVALDTAALVVPEVRLMGSRCGPFPAALRLLARGWVDPRPLIARSFPLAQGVEAIEFARQPGVLRVLLDCQ
ncbi:MAG: alcohol dehydrogenase catalytic domain-containing protein [Deltaproteobacteria bacterium]|nr:alcohol dehydrogenase catalytic domain-containing protein [Deltaproteobacteria bacterium]